MYSVCPQLYPPESPYPFFAACVHTIHVGKLLGPQKYRLLRLYRSSHFLVTPVNKTTQKKYTRKFLRLERFRLTSHFGAAHECRSNKRRAAKGKWAKANALYTRISRYNLMGKKKHSSHTATRLTKHPDGVERADQCLEFPLEWFEVRSVGEGQMHRSPSWVQVELRFSLGHVVRNGNLHLHCTVATAGQRRARHHI